MSLSGFGSTIGCSPLPEYMGLADTL